MVMMTAVEATVAAMMITTTLAEAADTCAGEHKLVHLPQLWPLCIFIITFSSKQIHILLLF